MKQLSSIIKKNLTDYPFLKSYIAQELSNRAYGVLDLIDNGELNANDIQNHVYMNMSIEAHIVEDFAHAFTLLSYYNQPMPTKWDRTRFNAIDTLDGIQKDYVLLALRNGNTEGYVCNIVDLDTEDMFDHFISNVFEACDDMCLSVINPLVVKSVQEYLLQFSAHLNGHND